VKQDNKASFKSAIIDFSGAFALTDSDFEKLTEIIRQVSAAFENNFFVIVPNLKFRGLPLTTHIQDLTDKLSLLLIDELIWLALTKTESDAVYSSLFKSILWFSKNPVYQFNKDLLRVEHIWKDFEWGKRKANYHELGKDPGNIWVKEYSEKAVITKHDFFSAEEIFTKLLISQASAAADRFLLYTSEKDFSVENIKQEIERKTGYQPIVELKEI
jgi:hypothetical protein